jgi:hypothetical protein
LLGRASFLAAADAVAVRSYYPRADDTRGEHSQSSWSAERRAVAEGEEGEWLAVDAVSGAQSMAVSQG